MLKSSQNLRYNIKTGLILKEKNGLNKATIPTTTKTTTPNNTGQNAADYENRTESEICECSLKQLEVDIADSTLPENAHITKNENLQLLQIF